MAPPGNCPKSALRRTPQYCSVGWRVRYMSRTLETEACDKLESVDGVRSQFLILMLYAGDICWTEMMIAWLCVIVIEISGS